MVWMEQQKVSLDRQKGRSLLWTLIIAGLVTTMMLLVREISSLFELVKTLFGF